ncbi:MAG TPA: EAL domain-containing protein [Acidimicrobiales bacterium]|nr:EAL domain-containing protein [Acidimicrobiales bacterium]
MSVILDGNGRITACSASWVAAAAEHGIEPGSVGVGADYLAACDADGAGSAAGAAVRAVLRGEHHQRTLDYECSGPDERRWFTMRVAQLVGPASGAMVTHLDITAVRAAELAVRGELHELWSVVDPATDYVFLVDEGGQVLGRTRDESASRQWPLVGQVALDFAHPDDQSTLLELFVGLLASPGGRRIGRFRARGPHDAVWRHFNVTAANMVDDPTVGGIVVGITDVSRLVRASARTAMGTAVLHERDVIALTTDESGIITGINTGACDLIGVDAASAVGRDIGDLVTGSDEPALCFASDSDVEQSGELVVVRRDGTAAPITVRVRRLEDPVTGFGGRSFLGLDRSQIREQHETLQRQRTQDPLTGLADQRAFRNHLRRLCRSLPPGWEAVVAEVALDRFVDINALHGSRVGDAVLRQVGRRLEHAAGPDGFVARLYGDVFVIASGRGEDPDAFGHRLQRATEEIHTPDLVVHLSASVGLRPVARGDCDDTRAVLSDASQASASAKDAGGGVVRRYGEGLRRSMERRLLLRSELSMAIERDQLSVEFQPVVRLADGMMVSVEALVRWRHPTYGTLSPDVFIPLAEQTPVIHDIGTFVLETACRHAARWHALRPQLPLTVAVNLSASQLADATLPHRLHAILAHHGLHPSAITLELTESMLVDLNRGRERLTQLKAVGVRIAMDDFGTGYSSLSRLKDLPLDVIKFDRSFITGIGQSPNDAAIVRTVVSLADVLGLDVIAEGVETERDARALLATGCSLGQGYLWSASLRPEAIDDALRRSFPAVRVDSLPPGDGSR